MYQHCKKYFLALLEAKLKPVKLYFMKNMEEK